MYRLLFLFFAVASYIPVLCQSNLEQLQLDLEKSNLDSNRVDILYKLAWHFRSKNTIEAKKYANEILSLSEKLGYEKGKLDACNVLGIVAKNEGDIQQAFIFFEEGLEKAKTIKHTFGTARAYYQIGNLYKSLGDTQKALDIFETTKIQFELLGNDKVIANINDNIGAIYGKLGQLDSAMFFLNLALEKRLELENELDIARSHQNIGFLFQRMENYSLSNDYLFKALKTFEAYDMPLNTGQCLNNIGNNFYYLNDYSKAKEYYIEAQRIKESINNLYSSVTTLVNMAEVYRIEREYDKAIALFEEAISVSEEDEVNGDYLAFIYYSLGKISLDKEDWSQAVQNLHRANEFVEKTEHLFRKMDILEALSEAYQSNNQPKQALQYLQLADSLEENISKNYQEAVNLKFENDRQKQELTELNLAKVRRERLISVSSLVVVLLLLTVAMMFYRSRQIIAENKEQIKTQELHLKNQELHLKNQEVDNILQRAELESTYARLEGRDKERERVAKDLHDRLGGMLATVKLYFKSIDEKLDGLHQDKTEQYQKANYLLDEACDEVRKIARDIQSSILVKFGLLAQLNQLAATIEASQQLKVNTHSYNFEDRLNGEIEIKIYRIIQELVSNSLKHAEATTINISLTKDDNTVNIIVEDDGKGFDTEQEYEGMGLNNVEARVHDLGGTISFDSGLGVGTTVIIDVTI